MQPLRYAVCRLLHADPCGLEGLCRGAKLEPQKHSFQFLVLELDSPGGALDWRLEARAWRALAPTLTESTFLEGARLEGGRPEPPC